MSFVDGIAGASPSRLLRHNIHAFDGNQRPCIGTWSFGSLPALIWYDFINRSVHPSKISFLARRGCVNCNPDQNPLVFQFVGTNDSPCNQDSFWTSLCQGRYHHPKSVRDEEKIAECHVKVDDQLSSQIQSGFRCVGLRIQHVIGVYAPLCWMRVWE